MENDFSKGDFVTWDESRHKIDDMVSRYGKGPFKIVELRSIKSEHCPVAVTIELADGKRDTFVGSWFKKVS